MSLLATAKALGLCVCGAGAMVATQHALPAVHKATATRPAVTRKSPVQRAPVLPHRARSVPAPTLSCPPDPGPLASFDTAGNPAFIPSSFPLTAAPLYPRAGSGDGQWLPPPGGQPPLPSTVPEAASWAYLITGFGLIGLATRRQRRPA